MQIVGSRLHDLIDGSTAGVTVAGVGVKGLYLYLLYRILWRSIGDAVIPGCVGSAVHQDLRSLRWSSADAPRRGCAVVERMHERRLAGGDHANRELRDHHRITSVERKVLDLFGR